MSTATVTQTKKIRKITDTYIPFSTEFKSKGIDLTENNQCVSTQSEYTRSSWIVSDIDPVHHGIHCWRVLVDNPCQEFIRFGVGSKRTFNQNTVYGIAFNTKLNRNRWKPKDQINQRNKINLKHFAQKSCAVDMLLDADKGILKLCVVGMCEDNKEAKFWGMPTVKLYQRWVPYFAFGSGSANGKNQIKLRVMQINNNHYGKDSNKLSPQQTISISPFNKLGLNNLDTKSTFILFFIFKWMKLVGFVTNFEEHYNFLLNKHCLKLIGEYGGKYITSYHQIAKLDQIGIDGKNKKLKGIEYDYHYFCDLDEERTNDESWNVKIYFKENKCYFNHWQKETSWLYLRTRTKYLIRRSGDGKWLINGNELEIEFRDDKNNEGSASCPLQKLKPAKPKKEQNYYGKSHHSRNGLFFFEHIFE